MTKGPRSRLRHGTGEIDPDLDTTRHTVTRTFVDDSYAASASLIVLLGGDAGQRFELASELVIGREADCDAVLHDDGVSRRHARITKSREGQLIIEDLGSRNGTFVNGERLTRGSVAFGDKIALGTETLLLVASQDTHEEQLRQAQKLQALGQLASGVSHDFNNILGSLLANVTYVATKEHDDETARCLTDMEAAVRRAVDLTRQLSTFGRRGGAGHHAVSLRSVVDECTNLMRRTLPRNVDLDVHVPAGLNVFGDASRLSQVLMNLCINAKDAMPSGGTISIRAETADAEPTPSVVLRVSDTGCGIDARTRSRIFEPFFTTKPRGMGTGLGLATVQAIVREHQATITVESELGVGTTFVITLPRLRQSRADRATREGTARSTPARLAGTVLLADDDELIRAVATRVIDAAGGRAIVACDGAEALRLYTAHAEEISTVILDLDMPTVDGPAVLRVLRSFDPDLPIFISSGHCDPARDETLCKGGATGILPKPFDAKTLVRTLASAPTRPTPPAG